MILTSSVTEDGDGDDSANDDERSNHNDDDYHDWLGGRYHLVRYVLWLIPNHNYCLKSGK